MIFNKLKLLNLSIIISISVSINLLAQLRSENNQADYIIITPSQFVTALQPFVDWRQHKNLNVKVAQLQQIYSEFPDSTQPFSIRDFISYTLTYWSNPKPKYILLVGGSKLLPSYKVPSMFANTIYHEDSVSIDEWYSINLNESNAKPEVDLGRFPVNNEQELNNIISKTIYFEDSLSFRDYPEDFLFLTDKTDSSEFEQSANQFINTDLPLDYLKKNIFAGQDSTIKITREHLFNALNNGTLFLSYYGHGAPDRWSQYNIFTFGDVDSLKVNNLPFIYTSAACDQSFDLPSDSSIVRKLIVSLRSGTVASVNSTGLNLLTVGSNFLTYFYNDIFNKPAFTVGDAVLQTKLYLENNNDSQDAIPRRYTLLGDPALKLPLNTIALVDNGLKNIPNSYSLKQNFPNPFNPSTTISYSIPKAGFVTINVFDILGREVSMLVSEEKQPGNYEIKFNGINLSSGIYFYQMRTGNFDEVRKFVLMK
ncbi:MAG: C25 family cysteine peptidase [Ignavibacteriaceae bacterium]